MTGLAGRTVVVTRAAEQAGALRALLEDEGARVLEVPLLRVVPAQDGGEAVRAALAAGGWAWVVVTSPNGAAALAAAAGPALASLRVAVVGPGTAKALSDLGATPALVPERAVAEGLLAAFPPPPRTGVPGVLVVQGDRARPVLVEGLRGLGWDVTAVVAYRTVPADVPPELAGAVRAADAVTFASGSSVEAFVVALGTSGLPPVVVSIGPVATAAAERLGVAVHRTADPHTLPGLVAATVEALR